MGVDARRVVERGRAVLGLVVVAQLAVAAISVVVVHSQEQRVDLRRSELRLDEGDEVVPPSLSHQDEDEATSAADDEDAAPVETSNDTDSEEEATNSSATEAAAGEGHRARPQVSRYCRYGPRQDRTHQRVLPVVLWREFPVEARRINA